MKKFTIITILTLTCLNLFGQAQITTKKEKLKDFITKSVMVVLSGDEVYDDALRDAVKNTWNISPYEFCSEAEYKRLKVNPEYYFLVTEKTTDKKDGRELLRMLSLLKGTPSAKDGHAMLSVVHFPVCAAGKATGREKAYLPAVTDLIQDYVRQSLTSGFKGIKSSVTSPFKISANNLIFASEDLAEGAGLALNEHLKRNTLILPCEKSDYIFSNPESENLVGFVVCPENPKKGDVCYRMVFGSRSHNLYFLKKAVVGKAGAGFTKAEVLMFQKYVGK